MVIGNPFDQHGFDVRFDWGMAGLRNLAGSRVAVIVDVLSFTTCVDIAVSRGATVVPLSSDEGLPSRFAEAHGAVLAGGRRAEREPARWSLSPASLLEIPAGTRLVLPSPNGSALSRAAADAGMIVVAACLRNAAAVAAAASVVGRPMAVIAAGERWPDGALRPAIEDLIGAGAVIAPLEGSRSPAAAAAVAAYEEARDDLSQRIRDSASGLELIALGFPDDVDLAARLDCSQTVPKLHDGAFVDVSTP